MWIRPGGPDSTVSLTKTLARNVGAVLSTMYVPYTNVKHLTPLYLASHLI